MTDAPYIEADRRAPPSEVDVLVIGAGPAGCIAARQIALQGPSVLLVERARFPRFKVCGCCISAASLAALRGICLGHMAASLGASFYDKVLLHHRHRAAVLALPRGACISRSRFDAALAEAAVQAGAVFLDRTTARLHDRHDDHRQVELVTVGVSYFVRARIVILATGLGSLPLDDAPALRPAISRSSRIGVGAMLTDDIPPRYAPGVIHMAGERFGYMGLARTENGSLNIAAALDPTALRNHTCVAEALAAILHASRLPVPRTLYDTHFRGTPLLTRRRKTVAAERLFILGDAAGYVEPFTGEGITWAIQAAIRLAPLAAQSAARWEPRLARLWNDHHRRQSRQRLACKAMAALLRRPTLCSAALFLLDRAPALASPLIGLIHAPRGGRRCYDHLAEATP